MKVLTSNIQLKFTCENCENTEPIYSDPIEMTESGTPICPNCGDHMVIESECIIKN